MERLASEPIAMGANKLIMAATGLERPTADPGICRKVGQLTIRGLLANGLYGVTSE